ncbi:MFS transporter [Pseudonocardia halophobica]|uniref:MFS transporter n=1 Tax=Pseudonocardia halophobica TaxID=29401 RepID=UPI003D935D4F
MNESRPRALDETLDRIGFTGRQKAIVALCALIAMAEGFDTLAIGYLIPSMAKEWAISPGQLGVAVTAGSIGMIVGLVSLGPVADRLGRRIVIIVCTSTFALFTGLIVFVQSVEALSALRFLAGLGLGAALANVIALAVELVPRRSKAKVATLVGSGAVAGGVVCGLVAQVMLPAFGWTSIFVVGAVIPLLLAVVAMWMLPESVEYLLAKGKQAEAQRFLLQIDPKDSGAPLAAVGEVTKGAPKAPVAALFTDRHGPGTILLWAASFSAYVLTFFLFTWVPTLLGQAGLSPATSANAMSLTLLATIAGGLAMAAVADRRSGDYRVMVIGFPLACVFIYLTSVTLDYPALVLISLIAVGFFGIGTQNALSPVAAAMYPSHARSTGVSWMQGMGRVGSLISPILGGLLLSQGISEVTMFRLAIVPTLVAAIAITLLVTRLRGTQRKGASQPLSGSSDSNTVVPADPTPGA